MIPSLSSSQRFALDLLLRREPAGSAVDFIGAETFQTTMEGGKQALATTFASNAKVQRDFDGFYQKELMVLGERLEKISAANSRHNAVVNTIMENRALFSPEEFTVTTEFGEGSWGQTTIPALSAMERFAAEQARLQQEYEAIEAQRQAELSQVQERNDRNAAGRIIDTLLNTSDQRSTQAAVLLVMESPEAERTPRPFPQAFYEQA